MDPQDRVIQLAAEVVTSLSKGQADALAADLENQPVPKRLTHVAGLIAPPSVADLTEAWVLAGNLTGRELALAVRCAAVAVKTAASYEKVELIYTGPGLPDIRRNSQALLEVVREARERLWVVSYTLFGVTEVLAAMEERANAGVEVSVIVDHLVGQDTKGKVAKWTQVSANLQSQAPSCRVLLWPEEQRPLHNGSRASLHAKCAVADGRQAFVSSANLTDAAMERNLEVGYLITGGSSPRALDGYFTQLVSGDQLVVA